MRSRRSRTGLRILSIVVAFLVASLVAALLAVGADHQP